MTQNADYGALAGVVSGKCTCSRCEARTGDIYRMVGTCSNCKAAPVLMIYRAGDKAAPLDCPICGNWRSVHPSRLATADEIPAGAQIDSSGVDS